MAEPVAARAGANRFVDQWLSTYLQENPLKDMADAGQRKKDANNYVSVPQYAGVHTVIGKAHLEAARPGDARRAFDAALLRDPDDVDAQVGLREAEAVPRRAQRAPPASAPRGRPRPKFATRTGKDRTASFEPAT